MIARVQHWFPGFRLEDPWVEFLEKCHHLEAIQMGWRVNIANAIGYALADKDHQQPYEDAKRKANGL